jgi:mannose-6-phosphate isomerase
LRGTPLHRSLTTAFAHAEEQGVDQVTGAVVAMLEVDGSVKDGTQRIWAQAEYLRALTLRSDSEALLARQLNALQQRFLHPAGWNECLDSQGQVSRSDMPSTTPYHLATCYIGLAEYFRI